MRRQRQKFLLLLLDRSHCPHFGPTIPALSFPKSLLLLLLERFGTQWFYFSISLSSLSRAAKLLAVELNRKSELQRTEQTKEGRKEGRGRSRSHSSDSVSLPVQPLQQCFFLLRRFPFFCLAAAAAAAFARFGQCLQTLQQPRHWQLQLSWRE